MKKKNIVQKNLVPKIHRNNTAFLNCFAFFFFNYFNTFSAEICEQKKQYKAEILGYADESHP